MSATIYHCSFCNKSQRDVRKMIAGPDVTICDECVDICVDIVDEDRKVPATVPSAEPAATPLQCTICHVAIPITDALVLRAATLCPGCAGANESAITDPLTWFSPKTEVRASAIEGRGLFAAAPIAAGEIVCIKGGHIFDRARLAELTPELGPAEIQIGEELFIGPVTAAEREGAMIFSNHSCEPNIAVQGQIVFVAMRDIGAGEELTHDWATTDDDTYTMQCNCGASSCRGTITGQDWRKPELQGKYRGRFSWYLERKIDALASRPRG